MNSLKFLLLTASLVLFSCAQEPKPAITARQKIVDNKALKTVYTEFTDALVYEGTDFLGEFCGIAVTSKTVNGVDHYLFKLIYTLHDKNLPDIETQLFRYDKNTNKFSDTNGNGVLTFANAILKVDEDIDLNKLDDRVQNFTLEYFLRVETSAGTVTEIPEAIDKVVADSTELPNYESTLNQITKLVFRVYHNGHYDLSSCEGMTVKKVQKIRFNILGFE